MLLSIRLILTVTSGMMTILAELGIIFGTTSPGMSAQQHPSTSLMMYLLLLIELSVPSNLEVMISSIQSFCTLQG
ncbi:hypothetical protein BDR04DRAFT_1107750 [Suillus decipiens]|nr:hypothetical protein BDR04DRAFT_1107750 [Suillus decipiens]